jgi:uncharacterized membrane protein
MDIASKIKRIDVLSDGFSISKYNLLKISFLKRLVEDSALHSSNCRECQLNLIQLDELIEEIPFLDLIDHRAPYERKFNVIRKHFHKVHHYIPPYYYSSRWTIAGILLGTLIAVVFSTVKYQQLIIDMLLAGAVFGMIIGYLIGSFKEAKFRRAKKII